MSPSSRPDRILLISDLHLEEDRPELTQAFLAFLAHEASNASALYILGDLFNVWIGDDDDRPLNAVVTSALKQQAAAGLQIFLMHGNRDFLLAEQFAMHSGATLISDPFVLNYHTTQYLLMHGDLLCTQDADYLAFRRTVRDPHWQQDFLARNLSERRAFAEQARAASKSMNSNKADDIMDVTQAEVERQLSEHGISTLIHGHTHRPDIHEFVVNGTLQRRIVLGDWGKQLWFIVLAGTAEQLCQVPLEQI